MDYRKMFDSDWLRAVDLDGRAVTVTIATVKAGAIRNKAKSDKRPVVTFQGKKKPLALNKTNAATIASMFGNDTTEWVGKQIVIYPTRTTFGADEVDCIRVKRPARQASAPPAEPVDSPSPAKPVDEPADDDEAPEEPSDTDGAGGDDESEAA